MMVLFSLPVPIKDMARVFNVPQYGCSTHLYQDARSITADAVDIACYIKGARFLCCWTLMLFEHLKTVVLSIKKSRSALASLG